MQLTLASGVERRPRGASFLNLLAFLAILAVISSILYPLITPMIRATGRAKLQSDIYALNQAVATYRANGGDLSGSLTIEEVLGRLRTRPGSNEFRSGPELAFNLEPVMQTPEEAGSGDLRIVWSDAGQHFRISDSGRRVAKAFRKVTGPALPPAPEQARGISPSDDDTEIDYAPYRR